jgi:hypothetical protein
MIPAGEIVVPSFIVLSPDQICVAPWVQRSCQRIIYALRYGQNLVAPWLGGSAGKGLRSPMRTHGIRADRGIQMSEKESKNGEALSATERRAILRRLGRFAAVSAPTITLLLAAETKPAAAVASCKASTDTIRKTDFA